MYMLQIENLENLKKLQQLVQEFDDDRLYYTYNA